MAPNDRLLAGWRGSDEGFGFVHGLLEGIPAGGEVLSAFHIILSVVTGIAESGSAWINA